MKPDNEGRKLSDFFFSCLYPGHYVPQLAELMLQFNKEKLFNLKGIAVSIYSQNFNLFT